MRIVSKWEVICCILSVCYIYSPISFNSSYTYVSTSNNIMYTIHNYKHKTKCMIIIIINGMCDKWIECSKVKLLKVFLLLLLLFLKFFHFIATIRKNCEFLYLTICGMVKANTMQSTWKNCIYFVFFFLLHFFSCSYAQVHCFIWLNGCRYFLFNELFIGFYSLQAASYFKRNRCFFSLFSTTFLFILFLYLV